MEQTVDDVVIIANGRLVGQGADGVTCTARRRRSSRTTDRERLAGALRVADVTSAPGDDDTASPPTRHRPAPRIGDVALRAGLPIYELRATRADLEALFFELTEGTNRNRAWRAAPTRGGCRHRHRKGRT